MLATRLTWSFIVSSFDTREHNIDNLRHAIGVHDWSLLFDCKDIELLYTRFLSTCKYLLSSCIPVKNVSLGPRDPHFITPLIKSLLRKRYKLRRKERISEADDLALKINELIANVRSKRFSKLSNVSTKVLWKAVQEDKSNYSKAGNTNVQVLLADVDDACGYFANVSFDPINV